jgi:chloramphenicol 3-O-phosphotransferase
LWDDLLSLTDRVGETAHTLLSEMHRAVKVLQKAGCNVIADHVLVELCWVRDCAALFICMSACLIGIQSPLVVLELHEHSRRKWTLVQARLQCTSIHKFRKHDFEEESTMLNLEKCT